MAISTSSSISATKADRLQAYRAARQKGLDWLLGYVHEDGSIGDPTEGFHFYRAPWTFTVTGESHVATAICAWIRQNMLQPDGTIGGPYRVYDDTYAYRDATLVIGAQLAMQYDLSYGILPNLLRWQDPISGGFACDRAPDGGMSDHMDIPYTCGGGFACLQMGQLDRARQVYGYLKHLYEAQPELPERFFYTWSRRDQKPITEFPVDRQIAFVVENQDPRRQRWTIGGIAAGFLCRLYLADPKPEYIELAHLYQAFSMTATPGQFNWSHVCKSSWGSSLLYQVTGEDRYLEWTYRMGDWYVETQEPSGRWHWPNYATLGSHIELGLEFVMHLDTLIGALAARP
ncbi:MAG TPA: hypothetical protein VF937_10925 [Chloroflexota bacterium]